jgi:lysophospholipid acyltransferase (LPLAT)-like uncharacterized protein
MARLAGATILPTFAAADRAWRLNSWDRFLIPKPFARVTVAYGEPFGVEDVERGVDEARRALDRLESEVA